MASKVFKDLVFKMSVDWDWLQWLILGGQLGLCCTVVL